MVSDSEIEEWDDQRKRQEQLLAVAVENIPNVTRRQLLNVVSLLDMYYSTFCGKMYLDHVYTRTAKTIVPAYAFELTTNGRIGNYFESERNDEVYTFKMRDGVKSSLSMFDEVDIAIIQMALICIKNNSDDATERIIRRMSVWKDAYEGEVLSSLKLYNKRDMDLLKNYLNIDFYSGYRKISEIVDMVTKNV